MSTPKGEPQRTNLHIGETETVIATSGAGIGDSSLVISLGSVRTGRTYFKHEPPIALEIEHAIEAVEDELFRIRESVAGDSALYTTDDAIRQIARVAGMAGHGELVLSRDHIEQAFDRLAALAMGRPRTQEAMPADPAFAATLLILREFMHHMQFSSITVVASP